MSINPQVSTETSNAEYNSIKPYRTCPTMGSIAHLFLRRIAEKGHGTKNWVPTNVIHDIYRSEWGSHINILIKLMKSGYLETMKKVIIVDEIHGLQGRLPRRVQTRLWRLTDKGLQFVKKRNPSEEQLMEYARARAIRYLEKQHVPFKHYVENGEEFISFQNRWARDQQVVFSINKLATKKSTWVKFYYNTKYEKTDENEEKLFKEAEQWVSEHPELATCVNTPLGPICLKGTVRSNYCEFNGERICIVPEQPVHPSDIYICRLEWLNSDINTIMKIVVTTVLWKQCPRCGYKPVYGPPMRAEWNYCPYCGSSMKAMIDEYITSHSIKER